MLVEHSLLKFFMEYYLISGWALWLATSGFGCPGQYINELVADCVLYYSSLYMCMCFLHVCVLLHVCVYICVCIGSSALALISE